MGFELGAHVYPLRGRRVTARPRRKPDARHAVARNRLRTRSRGHRSDGRNPHLGADAAGLAQFRQLARLELHQRRLRLDAPHHRRCRHRCSRRLERQDRSAMAAARAGSSPPTSRSPSTCASTACPPRLPTRMARRLPALPCSSGRPDSASSRAVANGPYGAVPALQLTHDVGSRAVAGDPGTVRRSGGARGRRPGAAPRPGSGRHRRRSPPTSSRCWSGMRGRAARSIIGLAALHARR